MMVDNPANQIRRQYGRVRRGKIWCGHVAFTILTYWHRSLRPFGNRFSRAAWCYFAVLDDVAREAYKDAKYRPILPTVELYRNFTVRLGVLAGAQLRKRGLIWKDADQDALIALYGLFRQVSSDGSGPEPAKWSEVPESITHARSQSRVCSPIVSGRVLDGISWLSEHHDLTRFIDCTFRNCEFSNASFSETVFERCRFENVLLVNARLTGAAFENCTLENVDLSGARLENVRFWYQNHLSGIKVDPFTRVTFPLIEECELSFELASRNYGYLREWYAAAKMSRKSAECAYREQFCRSQSYPFGSHRGILFLHRVMSGYNERPLRLALWLAVSILGFAQLYRLAGLMVSCREALYFSVVTFSTLGFGDITPGGNGIAQGLVMGEVAVGLIGTAYLTALIIRRLT